MAPADSDVRAPSIESPRICYAPIVEFSYRTLWPFPRGILRLVADLVSWSHSCPGTHRDFFLSLQVPKIVIEFCETCRESTILSTMDFINSSKFSCFNSDKQKGRNNLSRQALTKGSFNRSFITKINLNTFLETGNDGILPGCLLAKLIGFHLQFHDPLVPWSHDALHLLQLNKRRWINNANNSRSEERIIWFTSDISLSRLYSRAANSLLKVVVRSWVIALSGSVWNQTFSNLVFKADKNIFTLLYSFAALRVFL